MILCFLVRGIQTRAELRQHLTPGSNQATDDSDILTNGHELEWE